MIGYRRAVYFLPLCLVLKCLLSVSDCYIFERLMEGIDDMDGNTSYYKRYVKYVADC